LDRKKNGVIVITFLCSLQVWAGITCHRAVLISAQPGSWLVRLTIHLSWKSLRNVFSNLRPIVILPAKALLP